MHQPNQSHMQVAIRVVRYINQSPGLGIFLSAKASSNLQAFCDVDQASCPTTRRTVTGYLVKLGDSLISWKTKKQPTISISSAETEYRSIASTVAEIVWIVGLFTELRITLTLPVFVHCDSNSPIQIAANPVFHEHTKHIDIDCHFIHEKILQGLIETVYLSTTEQQADILTKGLTNFQHSYLVSKLGMLNLFVAPSLRGVLRNCQSVLISLKSTQ